MFRYTRVVFVAVALGYCVRGGDAQYDSCTNGTVADIGNGQCDVDNNNAACGYDGGDCCLCSCTGPSCLFSVFDCLDPSAADEFYECQAPPPAALPCSAETQQMWVVETSAHARALGAAVNCSGGSFEVEWRGQVVMDEPIYVVDGTVLTLRGVGTGAVIDGNAVTRLFTVVDASLFLSDVNITSGSSVVGGAIAAAGSVLTFNRTSFIGNSATGQGGAVFVSDGSSVSCSGGGTFANNVADIDGGAMFVMGSSVVSCGGTWIGNEAGYAGGALRVQGSSRASWEEDGATFAFNSAGWFGGGVSIYNSSSVSWRAVTSFVSNSANMYGGGLCVREDSNATWSGVTNFTNNFAGSAGFGGGLYVHHRSIASWSGSTTFSGNLAGDQGGAVMVSDSSLLSWRAVTSFVSNSANMYGGGLCVREDSNATWSGVTNFTNNFAGSAGFGGGLYVHYRSIASWSGSTTFSGNQAGDQGGAVMVSDSSLLSWSGAGNVFEGNQAGDQGGAVMVSDSSRVSCSEDSTSVFFNNSALFGGALLAGSGCGLSFAGSVSFDSNGAFDSDSEDEYLTDIGGALLLSDASASFHGQVHFTGNMANLVGGGVHAQNSKLSLDGDGSFELNTASLKGGALHALASSISWAGEMEVLNNSAGLGGGVYLYQSNLSFDGNTSFVNNAATSLESASGDVTSTGGGGGSICALFRSHVSWGPFGTTRFVGSFASLTGGALLVSDSEVFWSGPTEFIANRAVQGGVFHILNGSEVSWTGDTEFTSNEAVGGEGGAISSPGFDSVFSPSTAISALNIYGPTKFSNNTATTTGGALASRGACSVFADTTRLIFAGNTAGIAGGAIYLLDTGFAPTFSGVRFESNSAQLGGAVYVFGSGNSKTITEPEANNPTTFERCHFIDNRATATGGAIDTAAGQDAFVSCIFEGNRAVTGGALRLAGLTQSVQNCSFVENVSDDGQGAAVSNIGVISAISDTSFSGNAFSCRPGLFLSYPTSGASLLFSAVCEGCRTTCESCSFDDPPLVPTCTEAIDHTASTGGTTTLELLTIDPGYWRATETSTDILDCYNADACLGGVTGAANYCLRGYEGPYCAICSNGYTADLGYVCSKCSDSAVGIVLAVFLALVILCVAVAVVLYVMSGEVVGRTNSCAARLGRYIPLQTVKIVVVSWQILTQFVSVANVTYPGVYQRLLDGLDVFNFDLGWVLSAGCIIDVDFHHRLLMSTIGPIIAMLLLAVTYAIAMRTNRGSPDTLEIIRNKHVSMVLLLTFFVYSSVSSVLFGAFACDDLEDTKTYLRADYRIECDSSKHKAYQVYAGFMIVLYTAGIPILYGVLLFRDRELLRQDEAGREDTARVTSTFSLWAPYKSSVFYYEIVECGRRIMLAGVVVFIYPNTAAQIAITLLMAVVFAMVSEVLSPYKLRWDTWISRSGHAVVTVSMYVALLLKVDVSNERNDSQKVFEALLVTVHVLMVLSILAESCLVACAFRAEQREETSARFRPGKRFPWTRGGFAARTNPFAHHVYRGGNAPSV